MAALAAIALTGSRFVLTAIAARRLSQADFGQFAYAIWLVDIAFLVCSLGATGAVGRYAAELRADTPRLAAFMHHWRPWAAGLPLLAGLVAVVGAKFAGLPLDMTSLMLVALWAAVQGRWAMQTAALTGGQRFDIILRANLLAGTLMIAGMLFLPVDTFGLPLMFALMVATGVVGALTGASQVRGLGVGTAATLHPAQCRAIRRYALNIWLTALLWALVWSRGEFPIVRVYLGDEGVAAYAAAMTLFGGAVQAVMLGVGGVAPQLTRFWGEGRVELALATARKVMDFQLLACGIAAMTLICFGPELMSLAFGEKYRAGAGALVLLGTGLIAMALSTQNHVLQIATDARFNRNTSILGLVVLLLLAFSLTPLLGLEGAAVARASTMSLLATASVYALRRRWGRRAIPLQNLLVTLSICVVSACATYAIQGQYLVARGCIFITGFGVLITTLRHDDDSPIMADAARWAISTLQVLRSRRRTQYDHHEP
ncbi:MAG TPA: lipopolysaccharide biosynthesis protein [Thermodesulfobacteriota bacterium]|nr:lipopolysaccharide biosynthesis protein [Thermodesulfobacteriota bacterium]